MGLRGRRKVVFFAISFLFLIAVIANQNVIAVYGARSPLTPTIEVTPNHVSLGEKLKLTVKVLVNEESNVTVSMPQILGDGDATLLTKEPETTPEPEPIAPAAYFARSSSTIKEEDTVSFNASGSTDSDGTITDYTWDFGDGASGEGETSSHVYSTANVYTITLTVTDNDLQTDSYSRDVTVIALDSETVTEPNPDPVKNPESEPTTETTTVPLKTGEVATFTWTFNATKGGNVYFKTKMTVTQEETVTLSQDLSSKEVGVSRFPITSLLGVILFSFFILISSNFNETKPKTSIKDLLGGGVSLVYGVLILLIGLLIGLEAIKEHYSEIQKLIALGLWGLFITVIGVFTCKYGKINIRKRSKGFLNEFTAVLIFASGISGIFIGLGNYLEIFFIIILLIIAVYTEYLEWHYDIR